MVGTFPLNVQAGSPQYTLVTQIAPNTNYSIFIHNTDYIRPINNAYYTIQNADGSKWCTFYVSSWGQDPSGDYETIPEWSSSNTSDVFPEGSLCWCIWCKEYYDSLVTQIGSGGNTVKVSQLEWDTNLTIPRGYSIESAVSEVQTNGNMWVGESLAVEQTIECAELITSPQGTFTNLNVNGYQVTVIESQATINITSGGLTPIPITPNGVQVSGVVRVQCPVNVWVHVNAICYTPVGATTIEIGSASNDGSFTIRVSGTIPENTFMVYLYITKNVTSDVSIESVNITSDMYKSKCLI